MLPPSWKSESEETAKEAINADTEQRQPQQNNAASNISAAIKTLSDAQNTQTAHEDWHQKINVSLSGITILLVFLTAIFTGLSWCAFRDQLSEMKRVYGPIKEQADAARDAMIATSRAWLAPRVATFAKELSLHQPWSITVAYGNVGKEPGLGFVAQEDFGSVGVPKPSESWYSVFPKTTLKDVCARTTASDEGLTIYPSGPIDHRYGVSGNLDAFDITQDILDGTKVMFIHGCFAYRTVGTPHKSEYCFLLVPLGDSKNKTQTFSSVSCIYGNNAN
jgi:hypothetical protein